MKRTTTLLALLLILLLSACSNSDETTTEETKKETPKEEVKPVDEETKVVVDSGKSITTGKELAEDFQTNPFSIMIENSPAARPHTGLVDADIVYEFEVEGRITRYLAIFHDQFPERVGPVRSSRHYYLPVAESYNIPYVHYGGSKYAYEDLKQISIPNYDGMKQSQAFKRDSSRSAPHNAYFYPYPRSLESYGEEITSPFSFNKENGKEIGAVHNISYTYNDFTNIKYELDKDSLLYTRFLEGNEHTDRDTGAVIKVRNILFLTATHTPIKGDTSGRIDIDTKGSGELVLFTNGQEITGSWEYKNGSYHYYDEQSNELSLNPGSTWVQFIRDKQSIITK